MKVKKTLIVSLLISILFISNIYGEKFVDTSSYKKLKNMVESDMKSNRTDIYKSLKGFSHDTLFEVAEQASEENNKLIMFECIGLELRRRVKKDDLEINYLLDQLSKKDLNPNYGYLLLWVTNSVYKSYNTDELNQIFDLTTQYISKPTSQSVEQKLQAIVTNNDILDYLKGKDQVSNTKLTAYCNNLQSIMMDRNENSEIRRAAIKGIQYLDYTEAINNLIYLISERSIIEDAPLARSACIALARFKESSAIPHIKYILENTTDEYIYASAAIALGDLGGNQSLKTLVENENRFDGGYCGVALEGMESLIIHILSNNISEMVPYAVKSTKYLYKDEQIKQYKPLLKSLLFKTNDKSLIKIILERFSQIIDKEEAKEIVEKIPRDKVYAVEWDFINNFANSIEIKGEKSNIPVNESYLETGNKTNQEYGDAGYGDNGWFGLHWLGHTGLYSGMNEEHNKRIIEVGKDGLASGGICHNSWSSMQDGSNYWGAKTLNNKDMTFDRRKKVMSTAWELLGYDIEYPLPPHPVALRHEFDIGTKVDPWEITHLRCDGLVEYCYEYETGLEVWGKNGRHYDISVPDYVDEHNNLYEGVWPNNPDEELAPIVQCGGNGNSNATGTSTYMTEDAIIDLPTYYRINYTQNGNLITVTISATDRSGIHYIKYKVGSGGSYSSSPVQRQDAIYSSYTYQFQVTMTSSNRVYYYAKDNGGNYPEYALYFDVIIETVSTPSTPTGSSSGKVGQSLSFSTGGSSSNLGHSVEYQFDWGDGTQSGWGSSTQSHSYSSTGTKYVKAHSRCQTHTSVVSGWSSTKYVSISYCTLTINVSPSGSGNVSKSPNKTDYTYNETVQLTANANPGYQFDHWGGHLSGSDNPESLNMNGDKNVTAYFTVIPETVSTPSTPTGPSSGKVEQSLSFSTGGSSSNLGHSVEYQFDWGDGTQSGWGSSTQSHSYSSTGTKYVKAHAHCQTHTNIVSGWSSTKSVSISYCTLTIIVIPPGSGSVSPNKTDYTYNETVQLTANANSGYQFDHWDGDLIGSDNPESLNMNGDKNITAYFTEVAPIANFGADTTYGSEPLTVQFSDSSTGIINTWKWDFGDGQDSTGQNPIHTYNKADTFTVSLMVTGPGGSDTTKRVDYIIVTLGSGIENLTGTVQSEYQLYQNYPNPFNPSTTISYLLPKNEILTLEIIDISGKVIQTLVNETQSAGYYSVKWNASNVSSGIYIYRIDAGNFSSMKKCLLIK